MGKRREEDGPLSGTLAVVGFVAGLALGWQWSGEEVLAALIAGALFAAAGAWLGKLLWRVLVIVAAVVLAVATGYIRGEATRALVPVVREVLSETEKRAQPSEPRAPVDSPRISPDLDFFFPNETLDQKRPVSPREIGAPSVLRGPAVSRSECMNGTITNYFSAATAPPVTDGEVPYTPLAPGASGRLFDEDEVWLVGWSSRDKMLDFQGPESIPGAVRRLFSSRQSDLVVLSRRRIESEVQSFRYDDRERSLVAVLSDGEILDVGVRVQCMLYFTAIKAKDVRLVHANHEQVLSEQRFPLRRGR